MINLISPVKLLILFLVLPGLALAQAAPPQTYGTQPTSMVEVPIRISLDRLFDMAEREMPLQAGNWRSWKKAYGVMSRYRAWRGPLFISMQGNELLVQAHVRYWIQARRKLLGGLALKSSCGVNEPPRQAIIGVLVRFNWGPGWNVWPQFRVIPTRFLDQCEMTIANIDVTPLVAREFQKQLKAKIHNAFMALSPELQSIRSRAEQNWLVLQQPVKLWNNHWLLLNPQAVALSPLSGQGNWVDTRLALLMSPEIVTDREPMPQLTRLPPLMQLYPQPTGLNLQLALGISFEDLSQTMTDELAGEAFNIKGHRTTVETITLSGKGRAVTAKVRLGGESAGNVVIKANLAFRPETQQFELSDLDYKASLQDVWLEADARLFYNHIRKLLESSANRQLQEQIQQWKERLLAVFEQIAPDDMHLDVTSFRFQDIQLHTAGNTIQLNGLASGHVVLAP